MQSIHSGSIKYLLQRKGFGCYLFALCNALRYFGLDSPEPGMTEWEMLVDLARCRHGATIDHKSPVIRLGLQLKRLDWELARTRIKESKPVILTVNNPEPKGCTLHAVLALKGVDVNLINYHWFNGPVEEDLTWQQIEGILPHNHNFRIESVELVTPID